MKAAEIRWFVVCALIVTGFTLAAFVWMFRPTGANPPADQPTATAKCADGSYSFAVHHSGDCSSHGGVDTFYGYEPGPPLGVVPILGFILVVTIGTFALAAVTDGLMTSS